MGICTTISMSECRSLILFSIPSLFLLPPDGLTAPVKEARLKVNIALAAKLVLRPSNAISGMKLEKWEDSLRKREREVVAVILRMTKICSIILKSKIQFRELVRTINFSRDRSLFFTFCRRNVLLYKVLIHSTSDNADIYMNDCVRLQLSSKINS